MINCTDFNCNPILIDRIAKPSQHVSKSIRRVGKSIDGKRRFGKSIDGKRRVPWLEFEQKRLGESSGIVTGRCADTLRSRSRRSQGSGGAKNQGVGQKSGKHCATRGGRSGISHNGWSGRSLGTRTTKCGSRPSIAATQFSVARQYSSWATISPGKVADLHLPFWSTDHKIAGHNIEARHWRTSGRHLPNNGPSQWSHWCNPTGSDCANGSAEMEINPRAGLDLPGIHSQQSGQLGESAGPFWMAGFPTDDRGVTGLSVCGRDSSSGAGHTETAAHSSDASRSTDQRRDSEEAAQGLKLYTWVSFNRCLWGTLTRYFAGSSRPIHSRRKARALYDTCTWLHIHSISRCGNEQCRTTATE